MSMNDNVEQVKTERGLNKKETMKNIANKKLKDAFDICWLVQDMTGNVIASGEAGESDYENHRKATSFINAYKKYMSKQYPKVDRTCPQTGDPL